MLYLVDTNHQNTSTMTNQPIPVEQANAMIQQYLQYQKDHNMGDQTQYVIFENKELVPWFEQVSKISDQFRIFMGVYPPGHEYAGRLTVIVWPYKDGKPCNWPMVQGKDDPDPGAPVKPFNDGQGHP